MTETLDLDRFDLPALLGGCVENLLATYDGASARFPYSTRLIRGELVNDFEHPQSIRYTINSLLGLRAAARAGISGVSDDDVDHMLDAFIDRQAASVTTCADKGLLTLLLTESGRAGGDLVAELLRAQAAMLAGPSSSKLNMQDLAWSVWGASSAARHEVPGAEPVARLGFDVIRSGYVDPRSRLPRHSTSAYRRNVVSFGSLVYFLRSMFEYEATFGESEAASLFANGVGRALELQGPRGEWPWMIDVRSGRAFDVYPVFSVHQDSMAMLFLLPAFDAGTVRAATIERSLAWVFGENELGIGFYRTDPFFAYRSIERTERAPRLHRYARSLAASILSRRKAGFGASNVRLNDECRSYHLGWILYVWSGRIERTTVEEPAGSGTTRSQS